MLSGVRLVFFFKGEGGSDRVSPPVARALNYNNNNKLLQEIHALSTSSIPTHAQKGWMCACACFSLPPPPPSLFLLFPPLFPWGRTSGCCSASGGINERERKTLSGQKKLIINTVLIMIIKTHRDGAGGGGGGGREQSRRGPPTRLAGLEPGSPGQRGRRRQALA